MGPHFMLLLSNYILCSNVTYIYPVSCLVERKWFQNCFKKQNLIPRAVIWKFVNGKYGKIEALDKRHKEKIYHTLCSEKHSPELANYDHLDTAATQHTLI